MYYDIFILFLKAHNFSHRIDHFSIGEPVPGMFYPLNAELKVTQHSSQIYQYFIQAVPTEIHLDDIDVDTYQYSVTEQVNFKI